MTTQRTHRQRFWFFLIVAIVGLVTAWVFNAIAVMTGADYITAWFGSPVDWVLSLDLLVVAVAGSALMIFEAKRLRIKYVWAYIVGSGVTAFAFTFPLFLAMRERRLAETAGTSSTES
jgi:hypothetical protein